jgi:hypothetical protein
MVGCRSLKAVIFVRIESWEPKIESYIMQPKNLGKEIQTLLLEGKNNPEIIRELGISAPTISYHRKKLGLSISKFSKHYDWNKVNSYINNGHNLTECCKEFGMNKSAFFKARQRKDIEYKMIQLNLAEYSLLVQGRRNCSSIRRGLLNRMKKEGYDFKCIECGIGSEWNGKLLTLQLDHIDGDGKNHSLNNLRIICPNCHSQTETFSGRNVKRA